MTINRYRHDEVVHASFFEESVICVDRHCLFIFSSFIIHCAIDDVYTLVVVSPSFIVAGGAVQLLDRFCVGYTASGRHRELRCKDLHGVHVRYG